MGGVGRLPGKCRPAMTSRPPPRPGRPSFGGMAACNITAVGARAHMSRASTVGGLPAMEPRRIVKDGRELGNAAAAAMLCTNPKTNESIKAETYQWYVNNSKPAKNRAPAHCEVDTSVSPPQRMYDLDEVRAWQRKRRGRGNWGGIGARARLRVIDTDQCPDCGHTVDVITDGTFISHSVDGVTAVPICPRSRQLAPRYSEHSSGDYPELVP